MANRSRAKLRYGGYAFHERGAVLFGVQSATDGTAEQAPTQETLKFAVKLSLQGEGFSEVESQVSELRAALDQGQALLEIEDEAGVALYTVSAAVESHNVPQEWRELGTSVEVVFSAVRAIGGSSAGAGLVFTPGGGVPIDLPNLGNLSETKNIQRETVRGSRQRIELQLAASGQIYPPEGSGRDAAIAWLNAEKTKIKAAADVEFGVLVHAGERFEDFRLTSLAVRGAGDGSAKLVWSISGYVLCFPTGDTGAECTLEIDRSTDHASGVETLTVSGTIIAADMAAALAKAAKVKARYGAGMHLQRDGERESQVEGADTAAAGVPRHVQLSVNYTWTGRAQVLSADWTVSTRQDEGGQLEVVYAGRVVAATCAAALQHAQQIGKGRHPFFTSSTETLANEERGGEV